MVVTLGVKLVGIVGGMLPQFSDKEDFPRALLVLQHGFKEIVSFS